VASPTPPAPVTAILPHVASSSRPHTWDQMETLPQGWEVEFSMAWAMPTDPFDLESILDAQTSSRAPRPTQASSQPGRQGSDMHAAAPHACKRTLGDAHARLNKSNNRGIWYTPHLSLGGSNIWQHRYRRDGVLPRPASALQSGRGILISGMRRANGGVSPRLSSSSRRRNFFPRSRCLRAG
jgi:hypothetical protein